MQISRIVLRRRVMVHVCTICLCLTKRTMDLNGLQDKPSVQIYTTRSLTQTATTMVGRRTFLHYSYTIAYQRHKYIRVSIAKSPGELYAHLGLQRRRRMCDVSVTYLWRLRDECAAYDAMP